MGDEYNIIIYQYINHIPVKGVHVTSTRSLPPDNVKKAEKMLPFF